MILVGPKFGNLRERPGLLHGEHSAARRFVINFSLRCGGKPYTIGVRGLVSLQAEVFSRKCFTSFPSVGTHEAQRAKTACIVFSEKQKSSVHCSVVYTEPARFGAKARRNSNAPGQHIVLHVVANLRMVVEDVVQYAIYAPPWNHQYWVLAYYKKIVEVKTQVI